MQSTKCNAKRADSDALKHSVNNVIGNYKSSRVRQNHAGWPLIHWAVGWQAERIAVPNNIEIKKIEPGDSRSTRMN